MPWSTMEHISNETPHITEQKFQNDMLTMSLYASNLLFSKYLLQYTLLKSSTVQSALINQISKEVP